MSDLIIDIEELFENTSMKPEQIADFLGIPLDMVYSAMEVLEVEND